MHSPTMYMALLVSGKLIRICRNSRVHPDFHLPNTLLVIVTIYKEEYFLVMRKISTALIVGILTFGTIAPASAHGGGLDWQGGHNCRVGSCVGTYHCHQARAGVCAPVKKKVVPSKKVTSRG